jgi:hypothetical protein
MNINISLEDLANLLRGQPTPVSANSTSYQIGTCYLIRTVTMIDLGRLVAITDTDFVLEDASWVADTGRFADALKTGKLEEVEPFPDRAIVSRGAIVDGAQWIHALPRTAK